MIDDEPAFPVPSQGTGDPRDGMTTGYRGMTLRDWFAGQAAAMWKIDQIDLIKWATGSRPDHEQAARFCYEFADAMLAARSTVKAKPACTCPMDPEAGIREHAAGCPLASEGGRIRDTGGSHFV